MEDTALVIHPPDDRIAYYRRLSTERRKNTLKRPSQSLCLCKSRHCRRFCEETSCCKRWGSTGVSVSKERRRNVFRVTVFAACIAFLCQLVVAMGVTKNDSLLTYVAWYVVSFSLFFSSSCCNRFVYAHTYIHTK